MRVLTFGWDYPPQKNGGLGVACFGITRELHASGVEVIFVLPRTQKIEGHYARFIFADIGSVRVLDAPNQSSPYAQSGSLVDVYNLDGERMYSRTIHQEVLAYAGAAGRIAGEEYFDVIHAHDWTSYLAGIEAKRASGRPLILHVHATSFDQAGGDHADPAIYDIEARGFAEADKIITVSNFTREMILERYAVDPEKVEVVHNGCDAHEPPQHPPVLESLKQQGKKIVFFNGRITIQKGVDYLIRAARRAVDMDPNIVFVISGWGDMSGQIMHQVGAMGLSENVIFAGSLWDDERDAMYQSADLFVMPSVSEPFGLVPLEAIQHGTPVIISKQSGVGEVLSAALKVDFWDVEEMANMIVASLRYGVLRGQLVAEGKQQLRQLSWRGAASKLRALYMHVAQLFW